MNKHFFFLSAAAVLLFSCSRESDPVIQPGETITFTAGWAGSEDTRTILQPDGTSVWWEPGAQVNVFFSDKASGKFTSTNSQAQAIVDFQGSLPIVVGSVETENPPHAYWAVYPYDAANTCDGESVTLTIPSTQTAVEGTFANKMFPSIATSTNFYLAFYNICGGVRFTVANEGIESVTFKANNGESLAGKVMVGFEGAPVVKSVVEGNSEVVVNAPEGGFIPGKYYFAAILPQTLTKGVNLTFKKEDGKVASTSIDNSITINRSRFGKMEERDNGLDFKDDGSGPNPSDVIEFADNRLKEKLVSVFDTNSDGELSYAEAAAVTSIDGVLTIKTYTSFDEFQFFTGVTTIPDSYFKDWKKLTSITLPETITIIGENAFLNCSSLISFTIPRGITSIKSTTFGDCTSLSSVIIPEGITSIGESAFAGCSSLVTINLPESVTIIGDSAFASCTSLSSVILSQSITSIGATAFRSCENLFHIIIPESVTYIGSFAFYWSGLSSITIPANVAIIGESAFGSPYLDHIQVDPRNMVYDSREGCNAIIQTNSNTLLFGCKNTNIPDSVTSIGNRAFNGSSLESIIIPNSVKSIGDAAFAGSNLISISIPESITTLGFAAFDSCSSLSSVIIPDSITLLPERAFAFCTSLSSIIIPESVTRICKSAFGACTSLVSVYVLPETPPYLESKTFYSNATIYVPADSVEDYKEAYLWSSYADQIQAIHD